MNPIECSVAFGAPGLDPRWTSSAKEGLGTAYHTSCRVWFTPSRGIAIETDTTHVSALDVWFADLSAENSPADSAIGFTFFWKEARFWGGRNHLVAANGQDKKAPVKRKSEHIKGGLVPAKVIRKKSE